MIARATRHILRTLGVRTIQKKLLGYPVRIPIEIGNLWRLLLDPRYSKYCQEQELVQRMLDTIRPTDVLYDVGAFLGIDSLLFSLHARLVVSIEPRPTAADTRDVLIRSNGRRNLVAVRAAIGSKAGSGYLGRHGSASQLCQHGIPVSVTTIDALAQEHGSPDVIKVDVEGAEVEVLRGADVSLRSCRVVFVEVHLAEVAHFGDRVADVWDIVHRAGLRESATMQAFSSAGDLDQGRVHVVFERPVSMSGRRHEGR